MSSNNINNFKQLFTISANVAQGAGSLYMNSVDLFFSNSVSKAVGGVTVTLNDETVGNPLASAYIPNAKLIASGSSTANVATNVLFGQIPILTGTKQYSIQLVPDGNDPNIGVWVSVVGYQDVSTNQIVTNQLNRDIGSLYEQSLSSTQTLSSGTLKFNIWGSEFSTVPVSVTVTNDDYEFLNLNTQSGIFRVGEKVHAATVANSVGNVSVSSSSNTVTGTGTSFNTTFTAGVDWMTILSGTTSFSALVAAVANSTSLTLAVKPTFSNTASNYFKNYYPGTVSVQTGNSTIVGNGTLFSSKFAPGHQIVVRQINGANGLISDCLTINSIVSNTVLTVLGAPGFTNTTADHLEAPWGVVETFDSNNYFLALNKSTANNNGPYLFQNNAVVYGQYGARAIVKNITDLVMDRITPLIPTYTPQNTSINVTANAVNSSYSSLSIGNIDINGVNSLTLYAARIASKSNEILEGIGKSLKITCNLTSQSTNTTTYQSPAIGGPASLVVVQNIISNNPVPPSSNVVVQANNVTASNTTLYQGLTDANYISQTVTLADGMDAEDLQVFITAYKPYGTQINVYCKVMNAYDFDSFESKTWTLLSQATSNTLYSSSSDLYDYKEYQYTIPKTPDYYVFSPGIASVAVSNSNNQIVGTGTQFQGNSTVAGNFANGDLCILINGNTSYVYQVVSIANSTVLTLDRTPSFTNALAQYGKGARSLLCNGTINVVSGSANLSGTNTTFTSDFSNGQFIQIISNTNINFLQVNIVANDSFMNLTSTPTISNTVAIFAKYQFPHTVFKNIDNNGITRYYNSSQAAYDSYKYYAFKITMYSNTTSVIPRVLNLRAIAMSV